MNIRTMLDQQNTERPEGRSVFISYETLKYDIDIALLSEVRFRNTGNIPEKIGYAIYWNGKTTTECS